MKFWYVTPEDLEGYEAFVHAETPLQAAVEGFKLEPDVYGGRPIFVMDITETKNIMAYDLKHFLFEPEDIDNETDNS